MNRGYQIEITIKVRGSHLMRPLINKEKNFKFYNVMKSKEIKRSKYGFRVWKK